MAGPLTTQLVGSYAKPRWLIRHQRVTSPSSSFWRPDPDVLAESQDDATRLAVADQERAGLDVITDGEQRRQRFDTYFFRFEGMDNETLGRWSMEGRDLSFIDLDPAVEQRLHDAMTTRVVGDIRWKEPLTLDDLRFLKRHTGRPVKMTVIGPLTAAVRLADDHYQDEETLAMACAREINKELHALQAEGLDVVQLDEPDFHFRHDAAVRWGTKALDAAFDGIRTVKAVHLCYGYATIGGKRLDPNYARALAAIAASSTDQICIEYEQPGHQPELLHHCGGKDVILGVLNLGTQEIEPVDHIAARIRAALQVVPPERLHLAPDCGMWFLPRDVAYAKLEALVAGAGMVRESLA
jgi:5-methyltetrahydropteroyltriglutamate--homocysteine methyltransferase